MYKKLVVAIGKFYVKLSNYIFRRTVWVYHKARFAKCGRNVQIGRGCKFIHENIYVGDNVLLNDGTEIISSKAKVYIGNGVLFGPNVTIRGGNHRIDVVGKYICDVSSKEKLPENDQDVYIEDDVWIGTGAIILKGVRVGTGSIIGGGSVVTRDVPPYTVHVGSPAQKEFPRFKTEEDKLKHIELIKENYKQYYK